MDLAIGAKSVFVMMDLFNKDGAAKLVSACSYPLTGLRCVSRVYSEYAVIDIDTVAGTIRARETFGISIAELAERLPVRLG